MTPPDGRSAFAELKEDTTRVPSLRPRAQPEPTLEDALVRMLELRQAPDLVFQPIVDLQRGVTVGYEALSRFPSPPKAGPDRWFATALALDRGIELEALVIEHALAHRVALPDDCFLSINVAPEALLDPRVQRLLSTQPLTRLVFELTEHSAVTDYDLLAHVITQVRAWGGLVAVDDAGAGYASLQHVLMLRPDFVKLDRSLIAGLHQNEAKAALVEMFGGFTSRLDAWLLAEGIEEREELSRLVQLGVALGQGYHLGRPDKAMQPLPRELAQHVRATAGTPDRVGAAVAQLIEVALTLTQDDDPMKLAAQLTAGSEHTRLVLIDEHQRPLALVHREALGVRRTPLMRVLATTRAEEALMRALTRDASQRFEPIACCTESGQFRGLVRIERLIEAALKAR